MAYTEPPTFTADILTVADQNILSDDIRYLKAQTDLAAFSGVLVDRNAVAQTISTATPTLISFTRETGDTGGWVTVTSTDITVPSAAIPSGYTTVILDVRMLVSWASNSTGIRRCNLLVDGASNAGSSFSAASADTTDHAVSWLIFADAGTVLQLEVEQTSGGNLNVSTVSLWVAVFKPYA